MTQLSNVRVVLVAPSHPGNIGGAARALKTMGLANLAVVSPKRFPDPQAEWRAAGATDVLERVTVHDSVADAIADCDWVVGTSTRSRRIPWPTRSAQEVAGDILARPADSRVAVLFGRETNGLSNEELQLCHCHLQIPANPDYPSLNLAMAVQVVCYELFRQSGTVTAGAAWDHPPATAAAFEDFVAHLAQVLEHAEFLDPGNPGQTLTRLRRLFVRASLDEKEVQMLRGILKELDPGPGGRRTGRREGSAAGDTEE